MTDLSTGLSAHLPQQRLQDALDTLDAVFAPLAKSSVSVGGCTHCFTEAELHVLAGPVREVPEELMYSVAHKAPDHWDDFPALYRRLTPRTITPVERGPRTLAPYPASQIARSP